MLKKNLVDVFKHISMIMSNRMLFDFHWLKMFYMKLFLFFDLRTTSFLFNLFVKIVKYILIQIFDWRIILHYFDDFFTMLKFDENSNSYKLTWIDVIALFDLRSNVKKKTSIFWLIFWIYFSTTLTWKLVFHFKNTFELWNWLSMLSMFQFLIIANWNH